MCGYCKSNFLDPVIMNAPSLFKYEELMSVYLPILKYPEVL